MSEQQLIELLKKNLQVCTWVEDGSIHTTVYYADILICHSEDGCVV